MDVSFSGCNHTKESPFKRKRRNAVGTQTSYKWYVDTILQLISAAGDHVGDEVWYRVVQITTNTEDLQAYAASVVLEHLRSPSSHESLIKVGG